MTAPPPPLVHRQSHRALLRTFAPGPARHVDAVVVPAWRSVEHLVPAARLASDLGCVLLAMLTPGRVSPRDVAELVERRFPDLDVHCVVVPEGFEHEYLPETAIRRRDPQDRRHGSLATKRNLALLVARMIGWETVFFVDDDIVEMSADVVVDATRLLGDATAVGLAVEQHPDNSVVCHANRLAGAPQDVFVGACALLVDTARPFAFFPNVYNEDWLFLHDAVAAGHVGCSGTAGQLPYDPFHVERATAEEFGDVIAEGLLAALHECAPTPTDRDYWERFLGARRYFMDGVADLLVGNCGIATETKSNAVDSLMGAYDRLRTISPEDCSGFVEQWRHDLAAWQTTIEGLPAVGGIHAAVAQLGLDTEDMTIDGLAVTIRHARTEQGCAIVVPGFLDGRDSGAITEIATALSESGFRTLTYDPRGTWGSPGEPADLAATRQLADLRRLVDECTGERIVLVGHCWGAWLAGLLAADHDRVSEVVALMPTRTFIWPDDHDPERDTWEGPRRFACGKKNIDVPRSVVDDALTHDLPATLRRTEQRTLFVAGTRDKVVGVKPVRRLHALCRQDRSTFVALPVQHDFRDEAFNAGMVTGTVLAWLSRSS